MSPRNKTRTVFRKELRDGLRDHRALVSGFLFALFGPLTIAWALISLASHDNDEPFDLAVDGAPRATALVHYLEQRDVRVVPASEDPEAAIRSASVDAVLVIPDRYPQDFRASKTATVELIYDAGRDGPARTVLRVKSLLTSFSRQVAGDRLLIRGLSPELLQPVTVADIDLSTTSSRAARLLVMLPIFLLMAAFIGGMNIAIDVTAGERERGSLESLLVQPISRLGLAAGKWGAAVVVNGLVMALTLAVSAVVLNSSRLQSLDLRIGLAPADLARTCAVLLPLVLLAPALQMLISTFSRSFKEAQSYLSLLLLLPALPGFFFAFKAAEPADWMHRVPLLGHQILINQALRGELTPGLDGLLLAAATLAGALLCLVATARLLQDERIVLTR